MYRRMDKSYSLGMVGYRDAPLTNGGRADGGR